MEPRVSVIIPVYNVEKYVERMLESLANQAMQDFEAVIINDGSTDNSLEIIERFCKNDSRFSVYSQENQGVAMARNAGLDHAKGAYVVFYDPDDVIPPHGLQSLCDTIERTQADIVVAIMETVTGFQPNCALSIRKLAASNVINLYNPLLVTNFSLANKLFRRSMIEEHQLRFDNLSYSEDGAFVFKCLLNSKKIVGCNEKVYTYYLRPFWEDPSITQAVKLKKVEDALNAYRLTAERIKNRIAADQEALRNTAVLEDEYQKAVERHEVFLRRFYRRVISQNLIKGFYRRIWRSQDDIYPMLMDGLSEMRAQIPETTWESIKALHPDLNLEHLPTPEQIAEKPEVSFVITEYVNPEQVPLILKGIYYQEMPLFEILIESSLEAYVPVAYRDMANLRYYHNEDEDLLQTIKGNYVNIVKESAFHTDNSMKKMYVALKKNQNVDFAMIPVKRISETGEVVDIPLMKHIYQGKCETECGTKLNMADCCISNKLFHKDALSKNEIKITDLISQSVSGIFDAMTYCSVRDDFMISYDLSDEMFLSEVYEVKNMLEEDRAVISSTMKKQVFYRVTLPAHYRKCCKKEVNPRKVVLLEGEGPLLSSGLEHVRQQLAESSELQPQTFFVKEKPCRPFRLKKLCDVLADAAVIYTDNPGFFSHIKLRADTKLVTVTEEERVCAVQKSAETENIKRKLLSRFPQIRKKKLIFIHMEEPLKQDKMEQLGNAFGKKYVCVLWNETEDAYTNLPSYDASFVHVNSLLTKEEAIYLSDYVVSFAERDIAMGRLMQKPCIFWNNQSPAELVKML